MIKKLIFALVAVGGFFLVLFLLFELTLHLMGYHQTVRYERQGDLLFTPVPDQEVLEKISQTPTRVNNYGLRGPDIMSDDLDKRIVLCLGDSITNGYGVADDQTYPHFLQELLDESHPEEYLVLNAGVNAYPISQMREKYRYLKTLGIEPDAVIIGYSYNEGWLGKLAAGPEEQKDAFESRVKLKNFMRSIASYNVVIENWARDFYDRYKSKFVPGTNETVAANVSRADFYRSQLEDIYSSITGDGIENVIFVAFAACDRDTGDFFPRGELQDAFVEYAQETGSPILVPGEQWAEQPNKPSLFVDRIHLSEAGNRLIARNLVQIIDGKLHKRTSD